MEARAKLQGRWLDFRGCRIGQQPKYLEAFAALLGVDGCTAPDWWSGYPGEVPIGDQQVRAAASFKAVVSAAPAAEAAMNHWGAREIAGWGGVAVADMPGRFFSDFLVAQDGVLPVYEVDYSGAAPKEKHTLFWSSAKGKERWLESMWDAAPKGRAQRIARAWGSKTPRMPTLARHLKAALATAAIGQPSARSGTTRTGGIRRTPRNHRPSPVLGSHALG